MASSPQGPIVVTVVQVNNLPPTIMPKVFVEIAVGDLRRRTKSIKRKENAGTWHDAEFAFPILGGPSKLTFSVLHERVLNDKCLGRVDIDVDELLGRQHVILSLTDKRGNPSTGRLTVRIAQQSMSAVAGTAVEQAQLAGEKLSQPLLVNTMANAVTDLTNTASNQQNLVTSFGCLVDKVRILLTVGDEIAKIHPYANFAWQVLSVGLKMVRAQQDRDQKILDLVTKMEDTYSFVDSMDELRKNRVLQDIVEQILKQTIKCGYFIQEYMRHNFGEKAITQPFIGTSDQIVAFCTAFTDLQKALDSRLILSTALVLSRTTVTIDAIRQDQLLSTLKPVEMNEYNCKDCLPKTQLDVIKVIIDWVADESSNQKKVMWLYGLAGSGKSTLSTTIAWIMRDLHRLGAFFFFDRDIPERNATMLITMLAYRLVQFDARIGAEVSWIIESVPGIAERPLNPQWASLLSSEALQSVEWSGGPIILMINALDECENEMGRNILMETLSKGFSDLPPFIRVMVASWEEPDIHDEKTSALTDSAGGLFVWASTACLYIDSYDPDQWLEELITQQLDINPSEPFTQLDRLYKTGLQFAGLWNIPSFRSDCCNILGAILCARIPLSCSTINALLELPPSRPCLQAISRLGCVLHISETEGIRILHPSFHEYLSKRCHTESWAINLDLHNKSLTLQCIELLNNTLQENICRLTLPHPIRNETLPDAVAYACKFWVEHICLISHTTDHVIDRIYSFLDRHLLHWMEALAVLKSHSNTIQSLQNLLEWLKNSSPKHAELHELVYDGHRFAQYFANTIEKHPLLLYVTALAFTPANTSIYRRFYHNGLPKVVGGVEKSWPRELQQLQGHNGSIYSVAFSPDGLKIVSGSHETIQVWDASTSVEMLPPLQGHNGLIRSVAFSPDGSKIVSGSRDKTIRVWGASMGVEMLPPLQGHNGWIYSVAFLPNGSKIISGSDDETIRVWDASTGIAMLPPLQGHNGWIYSVAFLPDGSKIVSGSHDKTIRVWDASTGIAMLPPLQGHNSWIYSVAFSPDGSKIISGSHDETIRVWDASTGVAMLPPLQGHNSWIYSVAFSPDGLKIVSGSHDKTIRVWDASTGIAMLPPLQGHNGWIYSVAFLPDGSKIISGSDDETI
ncbi:hypothetical protein PILCRDRAFT_9732 [Piloderma croceum F 1598]|uniref:C2 domain-containing protein n=1 Tax=Piloderma croceum (strain F 1598) TaxID=765440 RepID=A0A0C3F6D1_PILCF|nr:hypothetical protein PILCRDRAFT_9732 [Piloderma croceum F 1598]